MFYLRRLPYDSLEVATSGMMAAMLVGLIALAVPTELKVAMLGSDLALLHQLIHKFVLL